MKLRPQQEAPDLSAAVVRILLTGWCAAKPVVDNDGAFEAFEAGTEGVVRLWRQHEAFLRAEARRLEFTPSWMVNGRPVWFGECCAAPLASRGE